MILVIKELDAKQSNFEILGTWEQIYNPAFKVVEFEHFKSEAGLHTFVLSVSEWMEKTETIGLTTKLTFLTTKLAYPDFLKAVII